MRRMMMRVRHCTEIHDPLCCGLIDSSFVHGSQGSPITIAESVRVGSECSQTQHANTFYDRFIALYYTSNALNPIQEIRGLLSFRILASSANTMSVAFPFTS
jgi:hypothetical protein